MGLKFLRFFFLLDGFASFFQSDGNYWRKAIRVLILPAVEIAGYFKGRFAASDWKEGCGRAGLAAVLEDDKRRMGSLPKFMPAEKNPSDYQKL
jgi:hypothetical protein